MDGASGHKRAFSFCFLVPFLCVASINQWQASFLIRMTLAYIRISVVKAYETKPDTDL